MIVHYWDNYHYIPLWVLVRILSFGKISKFYSLMKQKEQNTISRKFNLQISEFKISSQAFPPSAIKSPDLSLYFF